MTTSTNTPFQRSISLLQVKLFFDRLSSDSSLLNALYDETLSSVDEILEIAAAFGFHFDLDAFSEYLDFFVSSRLPLDERQQREQWSSSLVSPSITPDYHPQVIQATTLDLSNRIKAYTGNVLVLSQPHSLNNLRLIIENIIKESLHIEDLSKTHELLPVDIFNTRVQDAYDRVKSSSLIPSCISALLADLSLEPDKVLWEWPSFRIFFPKGLMENGLYRGGSTRHLDAHRDTWYGSPQHQLNFWGPISPLEPNQSLHIYPSLFYKKICNSSFARDIWLHRVGLSLTPLLQEPIPIKNSISPALSLGDFLCFSGHQLHSSPRPSTQLTRVSLEFRICCKKDHNLPYVPPNIDYKGRGEIYTNWFNSSGVEMNYYNDRPLSRLESLR